MAIGQRIKYFRNRIGMTQKATRRTTGIHGKNLRCPHGSV